MDYQDVKPKSQAELIFDAQLRRNRQFRFNVALTWVVLVSILLLLFSGEGRLPFGLQGIQLDTAFISENWRFIATGITSTIGISILSIILATILALLAALGRLSTFPPFFALSTFYVSLIRGTPLYLQIFFFFLALPQLGIILPQALRFAIPPTGNEFIAMTKDSALVAATGFVHELMWRATKVGRAHFRNLEALIIAAVFYWIMTLLLTALQSRLESRMSRGER